MSHVLRIAAAVTPQELALEQGRGHYAVHEAARRGRTLSMEDVSAEIARTRPLSATMEERIQGLRDWARGRTVCAH